LAKKPRNPKPTADQLPVIENVTSALQQSSIVFSDEEALVARLAAFQCSVAHLSTLSKTWKEMLQIILKPKFKNTFLEAVIIIDSRSYLRTLVLSQGCFQIRGPKLDLFSL